MPQNPLEAPSLTQSESESFPVLERFDMLCPAHSLQDLKSY